MSMKNKSALLVSLAVVMIVVAGIVILLENLSDLSISGENTNNGGSQNSGEVIADEGDSGNFGGSGESIKEFNIVANDFEFNPGIIMVNEGDTVVLHIESGDTEHGIAIPEFEVSQTLPLGETTDVEFVADKKGTYTFFCNVYCGSGHRDMKGTLVVN